MILGAQVAWIVAWMVKRCREEAAVTDEMRAQALARREAEDRAWAARPAGQTFGEAFREGASHPAAPIAGFLGFLHWGG